MATRKPRAPQENDLDHLVRQLEALSLAFTPSSPIDSRELFAGRIDQLSRIVEVVSERGKHAALYGERGVGKTSLANFVSMFRIGDGTVVVKASCDSQDSFRSVWIRSLSHITIPIEKSAAGFLPNSRTEELRLVENLQKREQVTPSDLVSLLCLISTPCVFIFDEFDRITDTKVKSAFAEMLKGLSDAAPLITVVLVGVAEDVGHLVGHHESVERCLRQIHVPRMSEEELSEIIYKGSKRIGMKFAEVVRRAIVRLSDGFPHYVHLLAKNAARSAIQRRADRVGEIDLSVAIDSAITDAQESIREVYQKATLSTQRNLFRQVLLAAARSDVDEHGTFRATDLEVPMTEIVGKPYRVTAFFSPLNKLCSAERGGVLQKVVGRKGRRPRYRFANPLMKPYVLLKAEQASPATKHRQMKLTM